MIALISREIMIVSDNHMSVMMLFILIICVFMLVSVGTVLFI